jgi:hypothetical protein
MTNLENHATGSDDSFSSPEGVSQLEKQKSWFKSFLDKTTDTKLLHAYTLAFASLFAQQIQAAPVIDKTSPEDLKQADDAARERFGISLSEACAKAGCKIIVQKPSESGKYVINIAQIHGMPGDTAAYALVFPDYVSSMPNTVNSQKVAYNFLSQLSNPTVVQEGVDGNEGVEALKYQYSPTSVHDGIYMNSFYERAQSSIVNGDEYSFLVGERELYNYKTSIDPRFSNLPRLDENYDLSKADDNFRDRLNKETTYRPISVRLPFDNDGDKFLYAHGAIGKLLVDGKTLNLLPGDKATHSEDCAKKDAANNKYSDAEYFNDREDFAISQAIYSYDSMPIILYGQAHNLMPNILKTNPDYGVIRIETTDGRSAKILEEVEEVGPKPDMQDYYKDYQ